MVGRTKGRINKVTGVLVIDNQEKHCPHDPKAYSRCSAKYALFCTVKNIGGEVTGAYLGCAKMQWTFTDES